MKLKLTLNQQALLMLALPVVIQIAFFWRLSNLVEQVEQLSDYEYRAKHVIGEANWISTLLCAATLGCVGYVITRHDDDLKLYEYCRIAADRELGQLLVLFRGDADQMERVRHINELSDKLLAQLLESKNASDRYTRDAALQSLTDGRIRDIFNKLFSARRELIAADRASFSIDSEARKSTREALPNARRTTQQFAHIGILLNVVALVLLIFFFMRSIARKLKILRDNSLRLAANKPLNPAMQGDDELAQVDRTFHAMAKSLAESRRRERAIVENVADVICQIDAEGRLTEVSPSCLKSWGYEPAELMGMRYIELVAPDSKDYTSEVLQKAQSSQSSFSMENQLLHKNQGLVDVLWSGRWSSDERSTFLVAHDITERKRIEQLKQQFVAMVSHDLRTPLCGVQGFLELIADGDSGLSPEGKKSARLAQGSIDRLIKLVNELLDLEKMESGTISLNLERATLEDIFSEAIQSTQTFADQAKVKLDATLSPQVVRVDRGRMVQVLVNLLTNAVKFSPPESTVRLFAKSSERSVQICVEDKGRGIPESDVENIFERFHQVEQSDGSRSAGVGLGLAICKAIVEQHGGKLTVESRLGSGSTFSVTLPVLAEVSAKSENQGA